MINTKPCSLCGREYSGAHESLCSPECIQAQDLFESNLTGTVQSAKPGDPRTFFYDCSFGFLVDRWTVLCLKRLRAKGVEVQKEIDFHMHRIRKTIETKISTRCPLPEERNLILRLSRELLQINAKGWQLSTLAHNVRLGVAVRSEAALHLTDLDEPRASKIRQLDLLVTGRTHAFKFY